MSQLPQRLGVLSGWGRTAPTAARVQRPRCAAQVAQAHCPGAGPVLRRRRRRTFRACFTAGIALATAGGASSFITRRPPRSTA